MITEEEEEELLLLQTWRTSGESCPQGTVPVRRIKEEDILRANSIARFGRKPVAAARRVRRDSTSGGHEVRADVLYNTEQLLFSKSLSRQRTVFNKNGGGRDPNCIKRFLFSLFNFFCFK